MDQRDTYYGRANAKKPVPKKKPAPKPPKKGK